MALEGTFMKNETNRFKIMRLLNLFEDFILKFYLLDVQFGLEKKYLV